MDNKKRALGKGLEQLFSNERLDLEQLEQKIVDETNNSDIIEIPISEIRSNPYQPRKNFDDESLKELSLSIGEHGVIQPIIVKKSIKGYEIVAGERRTKASLLAGKTTIPAIIKDFTDQEMMEIALIENIQRENLTPIEEAIALEKIQKNNNYTQEQLALKFGKSRSYITNMLGLLRLPQTVIDMIDSKLLSMGHARVLSKLSDEDVIIELASKVLKDNLSVRDLEYLTSGDKAQKTNPVNRVKNENGFNNYYQNVMREKIGTKVIISKDKITIPFDSDKDLERILEILNIDIEKD